MIVVLLGMAISFYFSEKTVAFLKKSIVVAHEENPISQPMEYERRLNTSHLPITLELPLQTELRFASQGVKELPGRRFQLPPGGYVEVAQPKEPSSLFLLSPTEGFNSSLKISLWLSLLLTSPCWTFLVLGFVKPGLTPLERRCILPILVSTSSLALLGLSIAYFVTLPLTNHYLYQFNQRLGVNHWVLTAYLDYVLTLLLAHGIAFSATSLLFIALYYHWISSHQLARFRRHAAVLILIFSALLTPPDIVTQVLLAIPLMLLFECAILVGKWGDRRIEFNTSYAP